MGFLICCIITPLLAFATAYFVGEKTAFVVIVLGEIIGNGHRGRRRPHAMTA